MARRRLVPWTYPWRNLIGRWQASLFSAFGIAMTVAVLCGVFALRDGFEGLFRDTGSDDVIVYLRPGASSEGESGFPLERIEQFKKERPEIQTDASGRPLAAGEIFMALYLDTADGSGQVMIPIRGIEETSIAIQGDAFRMVAGRLPTFGTDEIIVGRPLSDRVAGCALGETLTVNLTPFVVVGHFDHVGAYRSEIWGDVDRVAAALDRAVRQRVVARLRPDADVAAIAEELSAHKLLGSKVSTERAYFRSQTDRLGGLLTFLGALLTSILGIAAVLGAANTMVASIGTRTREIAILRSLGYGRLGVLVAFLVEAGLIGLFGGLLGSLIVLPLDGVQTGTMNWNTFTEQTFAFRVNAGLLAQAIAIAVLLGLAGGLVPSWRAANLRPVDALRRS